MLIDSLKLTHSNIHSSETANKLLKECECNVKGSKSPGPSLRYVVAKCYLKVGRLKADITVRLSVRTADARTYPFDIGRHLS